MPRRHNAEKYELSETEKRDLIQASPDGLFFAG